VINAESLAFGTILVVRSCDIHGSFILFPYTELKEYTDLLGLSTTTDMPLRLHETSGRINMWDVGGECTKLDVLATVLFWYREEESYASVRRASLLFLCLPEVDSPGEAQIHSKNNSPLPPSL
jgi:hypothetical protein